MIRLEGRYRGRDIVVEFDQRRDHVYLTDPEDLSWSETDVLSGASPWMSRNGLLVAWGERSILLWENDDFAAVDRFVDAVNTSIGRLSRSPAPVAPPPPPPPISSGPEAELSEPAGSAPARIRRPPVRRPVRERSPAAGRAHAIAPFVEVLGWLTVIGGIIAGIAVAALSEEDCTGFRCETSHPYVGLGIGIVVAGLTQGLFLAMVAAYVSDRTAPD